MSPSDPHLLALRCAVFRKLRDFPRSIADAERLCDLEPRRAGGYSALATTLRHADRFPDAAAALVCALKYEPDDLECTRQLGITVDAIRRHRTFKLGRTKKEAPPALSTFTSRSITVDMENQRVSRFVSTPPITLTCCDPPATPEVTAIDPAYCTVMIKWKPTAHDGGDEPFEYQVDYSPVDPMSNQIHEWHTAYQGIRRFQLRLADLLPETECVP